MVTNVWLSEPFRSDNCGKWLLMFGYRYNNLLGLTGVVNGY